MKKVLFFVFISLFCLVSNSLLAQPIQIDCNTGNVGIGTAPSSSQSLKANSVWIGGGSIRNTSISSSSFHSSCTYNGEFGTLYFDMDHSSGPSLYPVYDNRGSLGLFGHGFSQIWCYIGTINPSDKRQKENIKNITNALEKVNKLQGVNYDYKREVFISDSIKYSSKEIDKLEKRRKGQIGFLAQDVYEVLPEVVVYDDSTDLYGIEYAKVVPLLVEAIKEQQLQIETLRTLVSVQEKDIIQLKSYNLKSATIDKIDQEESELFQNTPNPFNQSTTIKYFLANNITDAYISVCNLNGTQLKSIKINRTGDGSVTIDRGILRPGIYLYALVANGELIDTKKMVISE